MIAFKLRLDRWFDAYRKDVTGAQASEKELELLRGRVPVITDSPAVIESKIQQLINAGLKERRANLRNFKAAGHWTQGMEELGTTIRMGRAKQLKLNAQEQEAFRFLQDSSTDQNSPTAIRIRKYFRETRGLDL